MQNGGNDTMCLLLYQFHARGANLPRKGGMQMYPFGGDHASDIAHLDAVLGAGKTFDLRRREIADGGAGAVLYYLDGFVEEGQYEKLLAFFMKNHAPVAEAVPFAEVSAVADAETAVRAVLSGNGLYLPRGGGDVLLFDTRLQPERGVEEPDNDRVLRGARDGFVEVLVRNTALIRRRIRDPRLTFERFSVGRETATDVLLCYMDGKADARLVARLRARLAHLDISALVYGQESLAESLYRRGWYNPFPKTRYTERPDTCAASLLSGGVVLLCDGTPSAMLLPLSVFEFLEESDDFYFPPITACYLRLLRIGVLGVSLLLTPIWYLLTAHPHLLPQTFGFLAVSGEYAIPIVWQLLLVEAAVDGLKLASLNTPSTLSNSFAVVGGLILGDFAVQAGWFLPEVILYMAVVTIAGFSQTSFELGYAVKFARVGLLILTALLDIWGLVGGLVLLAVLLAVNRTVDGERRYLYPFLPWSWSGIRALVWRPLAMEKRVNKPSE